MKNKLIEAILPEMKAESEKERDKYLKKYPNESKYGYLKVINGVAYVFKWSKDEVVSNPQWHFLGYEEVKQNK